MRLTVGILFAISLDMKTAITIWTGRVSPVFDVAGKALVVGNDTEEEMILPGRGGESGIDLLLQKGVNTLICGAISSPVLEYASSRGVEVFPFVAGEVRAVLKAWNNGELDRPEFRMPGCGRGRCCRRRGNHQNRRR